MAGGGQPKGWETLELQVHMEFYCSHMDYDADSVSESTSYCFQWKSVLEFLRHRFFLRQIWNPRHGKKWPVTFWHRFCVKTPSGIPDMNWPYWMDLIHGQIHDRNLRACLRFLPRSLQRSFLMEKSILGTLPALTRSLVSVHMAWDRCNIIALQKNIVFYFLFSFPHKTPLISKPEVENSMVRLSWCAILPVSN